MTQPQPVPSLQGGSTFLASELFTSPISMTAGLAVTGGASVDNLAVSGAAAVNGKVLADPSTWQPEDYGFTAWSNDISTGTTASTVAVSGTVYLAGVRIRRPTTITNVHWAHSTAGATPNAGQNFAGLISAAGVKLSDVGIDAKVTSANAIQTAVLATPQAVTPGLYWVSLVFNAATGPSMLRASGLIASVNNGLLSAATKRFAINGTGAVALPSSITPGSNTDGAALWVAVS